MSTTETASETAQAPRGPQSLGAVFTDYRARVRGGEVGALPAVAGAIVLVLVFTIMSGTKFTNAFNFSNLILQTSAIAVFAMGLVFALLLGEIDLSAGYTGGVCAAIVGKLMNDQTHFLGSLKGMVDLAHQRFEARRGRTLTSVVEEG